MLLNMKALGLYSLMAITKASPLPSQDSGMSELVARAKLSDFLCQDGHTIAEADIRNGFGQCRAHAYGTVGKYPAHFINENGGSAVLTNITAGIALKEFPIVEGGAVYTTGDPGPYRVITESKNNGGDFRGVVQHIGASDGGAYTACIAVSKNVKRDSDKKDMKDKGKDKIEGSNTHVPKRVDAVASSLAVNDLAVRAKKKKIGSADCNGVTLAKDDVGNAFKQCKSLDDWADSNYPHPFGNKNGNSDVFAGVTKPLREFPIIPGGTWTTGMEPGPYRVVTDYNNNFVGVMIESAGAAFQVCTVNTDG
ncbi:Ribonuclease/ribotoxin [Nemania abortiva]|nr:Ribonuclease/ribotoxin [Nemania abortiva]